MQDAAKSKAPPKLRAYYDPWGNRPAGPPTGQHHRGMSPWPLCHDGQLLSGLPCLLHRASAWKGDREASSEGP